MSLLFTTMLAALAMDAQRPPLNWAGPAFVCRMTREESAAGFTLSGSFGIGQRYDGAIAGRRLNRSVYNFSNARIQVGERQYSGMALYAGSFRIDPPNTIASVGFRIAYPRPDSGNLELIIESAPAASRPARLQDFTSGERVARGTCTLGPDQASAVGEGVSR